MKCARNLYMKPQLLTHPLLMYAYMCMHLGIVEITREAVDRFRVYFCFYMTEFFTLST